MQIRKARSLNSPTILYVDDELNALKALSRQLKRESYQVLTAQSGREALQIALSVDFAIDVVILDFKMPEMDGFELLRTLRFFDPLLPIIMLTGQTQNDIFFKALDLDCNGFIEKPYQIKALENLLKAVLPSSEFSATSNNFV